MTELVLSLASLVAVYEGEWQFSAVCIANFNASIIVPVSLYKFFFVNLVFSVLGNSPLRCAVFPVLSSIIVTAGPGSLLICIE